MTFAQKPASSVNILPSSLNNPRQQQLQRWLTSIAAEFDLALNSLTAASADASFRCYFRIHSNSAAGHSYIIMDSPVELEDPAPFVRIQQLLAAANLTVPQIYAYQAELGFLLLEDFGNQTLLQCIQAATPAEQEPVFSRDIQAYYQQALDLLVQLQLASRPNLLPIYSADKLVAETDLFTDWYLTKQLGKQLTPAQQQVWQQSQQLIVQHNLAAPMVYVHRDFMPRNLMPLSAGQHQLGILDFQDAVYGPITYDIACLMKDAFISWPEDVVIDISVRYWQQARAAGLLDYADWADDFAAFYKAVEFMGLQRHLKVAGIFTRLSLRDQKPQYLADVPRFIHYIRTTCSRYRELFPLLRLIDQLLETPTQTAFSYGRI